MKQKKTNFSWNNFLSSKLTLVVLAVLLLIIVYSFLNELKQQRKILDEISGLNNQINKLEDKNLNLAQNLRYYQSSEFIEHEAREKLNMARFGEHAVIITDADNRNNSTANNSSQLNKKNYQLWWEYFLSAK